MLQHHVLCTIGINDSKSRQNLTSLVITLIPSKKKVLQRDKVPLQIDAWSLQGIIWPDSVHHWGKKDYHKLLLTRACKISDDLIKKNSP